MSWAQHDDGKKLAETRAQLDSVITENLNLVRANERLKSEPVKVVDDLIEERNRLLDEVAGLVKERELTPAKLKKLYKQADCEHSYLVDRCCGDCGRQVLKDVHEERAAGVLTAIVKSGYPVDGLMAVRRLGRLLRHGESVERGRK